MYQTGAMAMSGQLGMKVIRGYSKAPLLWRISNALRLSYIEGLVANFVAKAFSALTGIPTLTAQLSAVLIRRDGSKVDYGVVSRRVVTTAFVNYVVDQMQTETSTFGDFKFHDSGVGSTAENIANTAMETTDGESRATGTQTEGSANVYQSVGTIAYTTTKSIVEHGLFNDATAGTLIDRSVFTSIGVSNGDSIQFTYSLTLATGG